MVERGRKIQEEFRSPQPLFLVCNLTRSPTFDLRALLSERLEQAKR